MSDWDEKEFPIACVRHLANSNCHCQTCVRDVDLNKHYPSCWVGKVQKYLGLKVTDKLLYGEKR